MITHLRAFAWLRWRLVINSVKGARRRDSLEQVSRILSLAAPALVMALSFGSMLGLAVGSLVAASALARGGEAADLALIVIRAVFLAQLIVVVGMPIGMGGQSAARYARLLLLPVRRAVLHMVDVASGIADPWVFVSVPAVATLAGALLLYGRPGMAVAALVTGAGMVAILLAAGSLIGYLIAWLMRDRKRAELMTLVFVLLLSMTALVPHMFTDDLPRRSSRSRGDQPRAELTVERFEAALPRWTRVLPSEVMGQALRHAGMGRPAAAAGWAAVLWVEFALLMLASGAVYRRLLDAGAGQGRRRRIEAVRRHDSIPLVSAVTSAIAMTQLRTALASVRGRLAVLLPGPMLGLLALVLSRTPQDEEWLWRLPDYSHLVFGASALIVILAVQPISMNQFGSDRAGLTLQFLLPISDRDLVRGKALGCLGLFLAGTALSAIVVGAALGGGSPIAWTAVFANSLSTFLVMSPIAATLSAVFPVAADLSRTGAAGNPHKAAMLAGFVLVALAAVPGLLVMVVGGRIGAGTQLAASLGWLVIAALVTWPSLSLAGQVVTARRENLHLTR